MFSRFFLLSFLALNFGFADGISVLGVGEIPITLDQAHVRLAIEVERKRPGDAQKELGRLEEEIFGALTGTNAKQVQVDSTTLYPVREEEEPYSTIAYRGMARLSFEASVDEASALITLAIDHGATRLEGIQMSASPEAETSAYEEALKAACAQGKKNAQLVANTLGVALGKFEEISIDPNQISGPQPIAYKSSGLQVTSREGMVTARVAMEWEIKQ